MGWTVTEWNRLYSACSVKSKRKQVKRSFMPHTIRCHNTPARMVLFNTHRCSTHNSQHQSYGSSRLLQTIVLFTLTDASLPEWKWAASVTFSDGVFCNGVVDIFSRLFFRKKTVWLRVNRELHARRGLELFLMLLIDVSMQKHRHLNMCISVEALIISFEYAMNSPYF